MEPQSSEIEDKVCGKLYLQIKCGKSLIDQRACCYGGGRGNLIPPPGLFCVLTSIYRSCRYPNKNLFQFSSCLPFFLRSRTMIFSSCSTSIRDFFGVLFIRLEDTERGASFCLSG